MRTKKAILNIVFALFYEFFIIIMGIIVPKLIIITYGSEINGLTSTINNFLSILNLIQAGAVGASIFKMFKPVAEKDYFSQYNILKSSKKYFSKIGLIFLILVFLSAPILSFSMISGTIGFFEKFIAFILLGINCSLSFFFISFYDILFSSNQKRYILSIGALIDKIIYYTLLLTIILLKLDYILMYVVIIIGTIFKIIFLYIMYMISYKKIFNFDCKGECKIENRNYLMITQISKQAIDAAPTIMISSIFGLAFASVYTVYNMIFNMLKMLSFTVQTSINELFGNVVVTETKNKIKNTYELMNYFFFCISVILCFCTAFLFKFFIYIYTDGNSLDINYIYNMPTLLFSICAVILINYHAIYTLNNVLGYFKETYKQSLITAIISIVVSLLLCYFQWYFVILGPIIYYIISYVYSTYIIYKFTKNDYINIYKSILRLCVSIFGVVFVWLISDFIISLRCSWLLWCLYGFTIFFFSIIFIIIYSMLFDKKQFHSCLYYLKNVLFKKAN